MTVHSNVWFDCQYFCEPLTKSSNFPFMFSDFLDDSKNFTVIIGSQNLHEKRREEYLKRYKKSELSFKTDRS